MAGKRKGGEKKAKTPKKKSCRNEPDEPSNEINNGRTDENWRRRKYQ